MKIALHDNDNTGFPNLALMKLSAFHKSNGDSVEWFNALSRSEYDRVYSSKIFTWSKHDPYLPNDTICGGTGFLSTGVRSLPEMVDEITPDYSLYNIIYGLGFLTRGCIRKCKHCFVPETEGYIRPYSKIEEIINPLSKEVILMDNNVLASDWGISQIEKIARLGIKIDFNQGLDARFGIEH